MTLFVDELANEAGTGPTELQFQSAAKAWFNYDQLGSTLNESLNTNSITDNGTGDWTWNAITDFANTTYAPIASSTTDPTSDRGGNLIGYDVNTTLSVGSFEGASVAASNATNNAIAADRQVFCSIFGTLA